MTKIIKKFYKSYYKHDNIPLVDGSANLKEDDYKKERILVVDNTKEEFVSNLENIIQYGLYCSKIFLFFEGQILVELTNEELEKFYIEDTYIKSSTSSVHTIPEITKYINNFEEMITNPTKEFDEFKEKENLVEEHSLLEKDIQVETVVEKVVDEPIITKQKGQQIVLVVDRIGYQEELLKKLAIFYKDDSYLDAKVINFYASINPKTDVPFLLEIIKQLRSSAVNPNNINEDAVKCYTKFQELCKNWYNFIKGLDVRDVVCKRVYNSDRFTTPEIVLWLWGYFIMGKKARWIFSTPGKELRIYKNEFMQSDLKANESYVSEANRIASNPGKQVLFNIDRYMVIGYLNYLYDNGFQIADIPNWRSDNISVESHIAGAFGKYSRIPYKLSIPESLSKINGRFSGSDNRLELYETFITRYYKLY